MTSPIITPSEIRALRGDQTRVAFAARLGVSELTIYRWEQAQGSSQARTPRAAAQKRLRALADETNSTPIESSATELWPLHRAARHVLSARFDSAENGLIDALGSGALDHPSGRAYAHVCTGLLALLGRNDARAAMSSVSAFLSELDAGPANNAVAARGFAFAALVFATPDGLLFAPERVFELAERARDAAPPDDTDSPALAAIAEAWAAFHQGYRSAFQSQLERRRSDLAAASTPVPRLLRDHLLALASAMDGFQPDACRRLLALANEAKELGFGVGECRALARLCMASHIAGAPRLELVAIAERYTLARVEGRLQPGFSDLLLGAAHAEALHGLGRFDETRVRVQEAEALSKRLDWPAADILMVQTRFAFHVGGVEAVVEMVEEFERRWQTLGRTSIDACIVYLRALRLQMEGDYERSGGLFLEAHALALATGVRPWLELLSICLGLGSCAFDANEAAADVMMRRVDRALERTPSPWFSALRAQIVGVLKSSRGQEREARQALEAGIATLELCGEVTEVARARRSLAVVATVLRADDAERLFAESDLELAALGIEPTAPQTREGAQYLAEKRLVRPSMAQSDMLSPIVVGVQRLSVRGLASQALLSELAAVVAGLNVGAAQLSEVGAGDPTLVSGSPITRESEAFEFGDGCGRRYRLALAERLSPQDRASTQLFVLAAALALEVNALRALSNPKSRPALMSANDLPGFVVASEAMREVIADVQRLARSEATVLIHGESGTGKEVIARAVHDSSRRASGPYITFNCTAVPRELFEGQLFGHKKGAFTGADRDSVGVARAADGGTLFLDEIGELPLDVQAKLLRFLENREVQPLGAHRPVRVDVRVVAATHRDLPAMVKAGSFRHDLLFRLQVVALRLPPLRVRRDDVLPLAQHFISRFAPAGEAAPRLSPGAVMALLSHAWPGNVRELRNVIESALAFSPGLPLLGPEHLRLA